MPARARPRDGSRRPSGGGALGRGEPPTSQRQLRVAEQMRHLLADDLAQGTLHDPRLEGTSVTIAEVRVSRDLRHALIYTAELGRDLSPGTRAALEAGAARLAGSLARRMHLKYAPRLRFVADGTFDAAARLQLLIDREAADLGHSPAGTSDEEAGDG